MANNNQKTTVSIPTSSILKLIAIVVLLLFLYVIRDIIVILFVSIVLASAFDPWVDALQRRKIPRTVGILLIYLILIGVIVSVFILLIPPITDQVKQIASSFPEYYEKFLASFVNIQQFSQEHGLADNIQKALEGVNQSLQQVTGTIFSGVVKVFGGFISFVVILVIVFYMTVEEKGVKNFLRSFAPIKYQPYLTQKAIQIQEKMGFWLRGQLFLSGIIALTSFVGLSILGVKFALVLALVAGITELVPLVGPIIGAVPAVFFALVQSPVKALLVIILYIVIQQMENHIIVPKVMQRSVGLNPVVIIVAILIGAKLAGILGMLLAVPAATIIVIFGRDFFQERRDKESKLEN